ncbi:MAG: DNA methyltransferase [Syntrophales bacterium]|jgi:DNA modification methylase
MKIKAPSPSRLEIIYLPVADLVKLPGNPRKDVDKDAIKKLAVLIKGHGFQNPLQVFKENGKHTILAGNHRFDAGLTLGMTEFPCLIYTGDRKAAMARAISDNKSSDWTEWDFPALKDLIVEIDDGSIDLGLTGFTQEELDIAFGVTGPDPIDAEAKIDQAAELNKIWGVKRGDIWLIAGHRVMCGDATRKEDISALLAGERADMVFTDPPYNVNYGASMKDAVRGNKRKIENDNLGKDFEGFLLDACVNMLEVTRGAVYICMSSSELHTLQKAFRDAGGHWSTFLIWAKNTFTMGRADYQRQYEPILYGWKEGGEHHWCGARDQGDVWFVNKPRVNDLHPTMKPLELCMKGIENSSLQGGLVLDPFLGSGSTMVACQNLNRKCRGIELDPNYCAVILQRMKDAFGITGKLAAGKKEVTRQTKAKVK